MHFLLDIQRTKTICVFLVFLLLLYTKIEWKHLLLSLVTLKSVSQRLHVFFKESIQNKTIHKKLIVEVVDNKRKQNKRLNKLEYQAHIPY